MKSEAQAAPTSPLPDAEAASVVERDLARVLEARWSEGPRRAGVAAPTYGAWDRALVAPVREILVRPGKEFRRRLFEAAYALAGGRAAPPVELALAVEVIHAGSMIVDDIEDGSPERRGGPAVHVVHGVPVALNAGNWMYFWPLDVLERVALPPAAELDARRRMTRAMFDAHGGQALDVAMKVGQVPQDELPGIVASATDLKTGALVELAAELGAIAAGGDGPTVAALARFGRKLGNALQMLDDLGNLWGVKDRAKRREDLRLGRCTWPWAWAAASLDPARFAAIEATSVAVQSAAVTLPRDADVPGLEDLAAELLSIVAFGRRGLVHDALAAALSDLETFFGPSPITAQVAREIGRLEAAYV